MEVGTISPRSLYASTSKVAGLAASVSCGLATNVGHLDFLQGRSLRSPYLRVAIRAPLPYGGDLVADLVVRGAGAQQRLEVVPGAGEQARVQRALGRQPHAVAARAEGLRHGGDDADLAGAVDVAPALGDLARIVGADRLERPALPDPLHDLRRGHHVVHAPAVRAADIHVLDEAHDVPGAAPATGHGQDIAVVGAALDHHVDLDRAQAFGRRGLDALDHLGDRVIRVVHRPEDRKSVV